MSAVHNDDLADVGVSELEGYFDFLDDLRESGRTNMFGARQYLMREYGLRRNVAAAVLLAWMKTFDGVLPPAERAQTALGLDQP